MYVWFDVEKFLILIDKNQQTEYFSKRCRVIDVFFRKNCQKENVWEIFPIMENPQV